MDYLPQNPAILVSSINMLLRDEEFDSLESLCYNFNTEPEKIKAILHEAGMGMKSAANRNFEAGILTDEPGFIDAAMSHFDSIWEGTHCTQCGRKDFCLDRIKEK